MHGDGKSMAVKFEFEKPSVFGKRVLNPKIHAHSIMHSCPPLPHVFWTSCAFPIHVLVVFFNFPMAGMLIWKGSVVGIPP